MRRKKPATLPFNIGNNNKLQAVGHEGGARRYKLLRRSLAGWSKPGSATPKPAPRTPAFNMRGKRGNVAAGCTATPKRPKRRK